MRTSLMGRIVPLALVVLLTAGFVLAADINKLPPDNWQPASRGRMHLLTDATSPRAFIGLPPCRIVDTRGNGAPIQGGAFAADEVRTWVIAGICGLPIGTDAVSLNITVTSTGAHPFGYVKVWPGGAAEPTVSTLNWNAAGLTIANAAVVPLGTSPAGSISLRSGNAGAHVIVDVNGYFSAVLGTPGNFFQLTTNSGGYTAFLQNLSTSCGGACGIYQGVGSGIAGYFENTSASDAGAKGLYGIVGSTATGVAGVSGFANGSTGTTYGVFGRSSSTTGGPAGVIGQDSSGYNPSTSGSSGVIGNSRDSFGVLGQSRYISVYGQLRTSIDGLGAFGLLGTTFGTAADATTGPWAVFAGGNFGASGAKHFVEPHPTDAKKVIMYSSLEGREVGTYFRGTARIVNHQAIIEIPEDFRIVTDEEGLTIQVTPIGGYSQVYIESQDLAQVVVKGSRDVQFHYLVQGVRRAFKDLQPVQTGYMFMPESASDRIPAYLTEEAKRRLISNGTYNQDGTVNMTTAEKAGFTKIWADREAERAAASRAAQEKSTGK